MATVKFLQATDMASLPTNSSVAISSLFGTDGEMDMVSDFDASVLSLGSFDSLNFATEGTITQAFVDTGDFGSFPNFQITGLDYRLTVDFYNTVVSHGDALDFVSALLAGSDTITGSAHNDTIMGFGGDDTIIGGAGADALFGGTGVNTASYSTAPAGLFAGLEDINANTGDAAGDTYNSIQNLEGSAFNDVLYGSSVANRLSGGAGNDVLVGKGGADVFDGGPGIDEVSYDASFGVLADLQDPSVNTGYAAGAAYISIENLTGSSLDDQLYGDNNANVLRGNYFPGLASGVDRLYGRGGDDTLDGGDGADAMYGGTGDDLYYVDNVGDTVHEASNEGVDKVISSVSYSVSGQSIEQLTLTGNANINATGNTLANTLVGNSGDNRIEGGLGNDTLTGGSGSDTFVFDTALTANVDTITDFNAANDKIQLDRSTFTAITQLGTLSAAAFHIGTAAHDSNDYIVYNSATGDLLYDRDGTGAAAAVKFAHLNGTPALTNASFTVVA